MNTDTSRNTVHRVEKTINVLISAFFKEHLVHSDGCACAVGNMVASACGIKLFQHESGLFDWEFVTASWLYPVLMPDTNIPSHKVEGERQVQSTGYSVKELHLIEKAFEGRHNGYLGNDPDSFKGLSDVFDVLPLLDPDYFEQKPIRIIEDKLTLEPALH